MASRLFFDGDELDVAALDREARALARLILVVGAVALIPIAARWLLVETLGFVSVFATLLTVTAQFVLAVGTAVVLLYVVARGTELAGE
jgi:uncharacterized membrane protein (UPF0182 family)